MKQIKDSLVLPTLDTGTTAALYTKIVSKGNVNKIKLEIIILLF